MKHFKRNTIQVHQQAGDDVGNPQYNRRTEYANVKKDSGNSKVPGVPHSEGKPTSETYRQGGHARGKAPEMGKNKPNMHQKPAVADYHDKGQNGEWANPRLSPYASLPTNRLGQRKGHSD